MQVKRLNHYLAEYRRYLEGPASGQFLYIWESQRIFQKVWEKDPPDWKAMYDQALDNPHTRRLWKREAYEPKAMMLQFLELQPVFVRQAFEDLFEEEKELDGRASRFLFYCDALLEAYREAYPLSPNNNHYHDDDYQMVFLYLSFRFPDRYTLYDAGVFYRTLEKLGSPKLPVGNDIIRFAKVTRTLYNFLQKDEKIMALHRQRLEEGRHYTGESWLLVYDFYQTITGAWRGLRDFSTK